MSEKRYNAFISYRHVERDKEIAIRLQKLLETYKPPKNGNYKNTTKIKKVFRDESELPTSGNLGSDIKQALEQSDFLVVICSEETSKSPWCMQEIDYFKQIHNGQCDNILTLLVSGNPREVFPKALCYEVKPIADNNGEIIHQQIEVEPLAANVTANTLSESKRKLNTEFLRIAAPILGCSFDDLYQRHQRRYVKKIIAAAAAIISLTLAFSIYAVTNISMLNSQAEQILEKKSELEKANVELLEGKQKIEETNELLEQKNDDLLIQMEETTKQKVIAEEQRTIAEKNEQKAIDNLNYANEQKAYAEENYKEAKKQEQLANENRIQAEDNLSVAEKQKNLALSSQSRFLADLSDQLLTKGDRITALMLALEGLPKNLDNPERPYVKQAENALRKALIGFELSLVANDPGVFYQNILNHTDIKGYCTGTGPDRMYTISNESIRLWNTQNGQIIDEILINPHGTMTYVTYQESNQYLLVEAYDYITTEVGFTYHTVTTGDVYLILKSKDHIVLSASFKGTKKMLKSKKENRAICVLENNIPMYIDYDTGVITEKKKLSKLFSDLVNKDYLQTGDISKDEKFLSICEVNYDKMHIASMQNGTILKTIKNNIVDSCFLSDNSLLYEVISTDEGIYRYSSGRSEVLKDFDDINVLNSRDYMFRYESLDSALYLIAPDNRINKSAAIEYICDNIEISPDDKYAFLSSTDTGSFFIVALSDMKVVHKTKLGKENLAEGKRLLKFSPDMAYVLSYDPFHLNPAIVFDVMTGKQVTILSKTAGEKIYGSGFLTDHRMLIRNEDGIKVIELGKTDQVNYVETAEHYNFADFGDLSGDNVIYSNDYDYYYHFDVMDSKSGRMLTDWGKDLSYEGGFYDRKNNKSILLSTNGRSLVPVLVQDKKYTTVDYNKGERYYGSHISKDGQRYLLYSDKHVVIYSMDSADKREIPNPIEKDIQGAVFHPDNRTVSLVYLDRIICYDINNGALLREIPIDNSGYDHMKISPAGNCFILYTGKENYHTPGGKLIAVYNSYSGDLLYEKQMANNLMDVNVSGDGSKLLLAFDDKLKLYSLSSGDELQELPCPSLDEGDNEGCCSINYNGTKVLLHYPYTLTYIWDLTYDAKELVREAKELLGGRSFTEEERKEYYQE